MFNQISKSTAILAVHVVLLTGPLSSSLVFAHGGSHGPSAPSAPSTPNASSSQQSSGGELSPEDLKLDPRALQPTHGGQVTVTKWRFFEVVYTPQETRLYIYSPSKRPLCARSTTGTVILQVNGNPKEFRYPLKPIVDDSQFGRDMGYLVAAVDVTSVRDGDMQVTFDLKLSSREEPATRFTQTFALTRPPLTVTEARLTAADRPLIERQWMCPVMENTELGAHGEPIKLMVGDQTLFVCCEGCVEDVKKASRPYLEKAAKLAQSSRPLVTNREPPRTRAAVYWASHTDDAAIRAQGQCPVMDGPLGAHGRVIKVVMDGLPIFVCCDGCIEKVVRNRDYYFRKVDALAARQTSASTRNELPQMQQHFAISYATQADRPAIEAQGVCPVMNQQLGAHGTPINVVVEGQPVFVCCEGCVERVQSNPALYLALATRGEQPTKAAGGSCCSIGSGGGRGEKSCCH